MQPNPLRTALAVCVAVLASASGATRAQELGAPAEGMAIAWRAPAVPSMPTVTWRFTSVQGSTTTLRSETRTLFERMTTESTMYRVIFPLRSVDPFGTISEFEYDRASLDEIGRLDEGKSVRIAVKTIMTTTHAQLKEPIRREFSGFTVLTVERHEAVSVPAGKFDTVVIRLEADSVPVSPAVHRVVRRYWYAPAIGWYVRHEILATGPALDQRHEYVAVKITQPEERAQRR